MPSDIVVSHSARLCLSSSTPLSNISPRPFKAMSFMYSARFESCVLSSSSSSDGSKSISTPPSSISVISAPSTISGPPISISYSASPSGMSTSTPPIPSNWGRSVSAIVIGLRAIMPPINKTMRVQAVRRIPLHTGYPYCEPSQTA